MSEVKVKRPAWKPTATYTAGLKLVDLVSDPTRRPRFEAKKLTPDQVAGIRNNALALRETTRAAARGLQGQVAASKVLLAECWRAAEWISRVREALKRGGVSKGALAKAGVGKIVSAERSGTVQNALEALLDTAAHDRFGPELDAVGFDAAEVGKAQGFLARVDALDLTQEAAKGGRKTRTTSRRGLHGLVQDGANRILALAHLIYAEDPETLKLFSDCLPRSTGGTGAEVPEEQPMVDNPK